MKDKLFCLCGCKQEIIFKPYHKYRKVVYISGHNQRGKKIHHSHETILKIKTKTKEAMNTQQVKNKLKKGLDCYWNSDNSISRKKFFGKIAAQKQASIKGKTYEEIYGIEKAKKIKETLSNSQINSLNHSTRGKKRKKETIDKIRKARFEQKICTKNTTPEIITKNILDNLKIDYIPQYNIRYKTIADFFLPKFNIVIYCDGCYWHCHKHMNQPSDKIINNMSVKQIRQKDKQISKFVSSLGYMVIRFWECELKSRLKDVETNIKELINARNS